MDFAIPPGLRTCRSRIIARDIIPLESDPRRTEHFSTTPSAAN